MRSTTSFRLPPTSHPRLEPGPKPDRTLASTPNTNPKPTQVNPKIPDFYTALYFGLTTLTTVGFGDIYPVTDQGRLVVSLSIIAGVAVVPVQLAALGEAVLMPESVKGDRAGDGLALQDGSDQARAGKPFSPSPSTTATQGQQGAPVGTSPDTEQSWQQVQQRQQRRRRREVTTMATSSSTNVHAAMDAPRPVVSVELDFTRQCATCGEAVHFAPAAFCHACGGELDAPLQRE